MAKELNAIDISDTPELLRLAEEVRATNRPRILRRADEDIAVIAPMHKNPVPSPFKKKSAKDIAAFLSAAGSWKDEDTDTLKANIYESRRLSTKPRPDL